MVHKYVLPQLRRRTISSAGQFFLGVLHEDLSLPEWRLSGCGGLERRSRGVPNIVWTLCGLSMLEYVEWKSPASRSLGEKRLKSGRYHEEEPVGEHLVFL